MPLLKHSHILPAISVQRRGLSLGARLKSTVVCRFASRSFGMVIGRRDNLRKPRMNQRIRVFAPATIANLGPGFDVLGLALSRPGDELDAELSDRPGVEIADVTGDGGALSRDPEKNVVGRAAAAVLRRAGARYGVPSLAAQAHAARERARQFRRKQRGGCRGRQRIARPAALAKRGRVERHGGRARRIRNAARRQRGAERHGRRGARAQL